MPKVTYPSVGVVILTYNSSAYIAQCLHSVFENAYPNFSVTVVDNASTDNTVQVIQKNFPYVILCASEESSVKRSVTSFKMTKKVSFIQNKINLGYGAGNNIAIKELRKKRLDYILLLNPDTTLEPSTISDLVAVFTTDTTIGIVGPMIMYMQDPTKIWYAGGYFNKPFCFTRHPFMNRQYKRVARSEESQKRSSLSHSQTAHVERVFEKEIGTGPVIRSGPTDFITGACMMIKTAVFNQTGLLPERYFLYYEDAFFCQKARSFGYSCFLLAKPLVYHQVSASTGVSGKNDFTASKAYFFARNPTLYLRHEVQGIWKITGLLGQWVIQHPYFLWDMLKKNQWPAIGGYIRGIRDGLIM